MLGSAMMVIWFLGTALELSVVVCALVRKSFLRYFFLNLYMLSSVVASIGRYSLLLMYGLDSAQYCYFYFYTDALLTITLYIAIISLFSDVFGQLHFAKHLRLAAVVLLMGTAGFSYAVVAQSETRLVTDYVFELSRNLYFVGLILTYLLWGAVLKLRETRTRLVQFILSLGIYFSANAASYALMNTTSKYDHFLDYFAQTVACLLPLAWSVTLMRHDEDARLAPSHLVAVPR